MMRGCVRWGFWAGLLALGCAARDTSTSPPIEAAAVETEMAETASVTNFDDPVVAKIVELGRRDSQVERLARVLTEEIGGRLTGSHALMDAERWAAEEFNRWGVKAWLEPWGEFPVGFDRGPWSGGQVAPKEIAYEFITPAWSPGVSGPQRGAALLYPEQVPSAKARAEFAGAWVVKPRWKPEDAPSAKVQAEIDKLLTEVGALGVLEADRDEKNELVHTGGRPYISWGALPELVQIRLRGDQHDALVTQLASGVGVELSFSVDNRFFKGPVIQHNVIAEIPGSELPDEYVVVGGHLDSWDGAQGAVDNATGVATTMEAARLLMAADARPKRTIRFMLWSGEEQGLLGSRGYVKEHAEEMDRVSAVFVHDGGTNYLAGLTVTPEMMEQMTKVFAPVMQLDERFPFALYPTDAVRGGGSDHSSFISAGVPGFFWIQDGTSNYRCHHHTQYDNFEAINPDYQQHSAMVVAIAAWNVANLDEKIARHNMNALEYPPSGIELDGTVVRAIKAGSPAARAKLKPSDELVSIDGTPVTSGYTLYRATRQDPPQKKIVVRRRGKSLELALDLSDPEIEAQREERAKERLERFGPDALNVPEAFEKRRAKLFGDPEQSCRP